MAAAIVSIILDIFDEDDDDRQLPVRLEGCHEQNFRHFWMMNESYQIDWRGGGRLVQSYCWLSWEGFGPQAGRRPA